MKQELVRPSPGADLTERYVPEKAAKFRQDYQRDRDRLLYSSAFLRLSNVTQVASPEVGHVFHSRLTHSLKVAQVGRRLCERLKTNDQTESDDIRDYLDPDAVEAAALAHDFGHPPFGHLAEETLDKLAEGVGGFEGNAQSFRILTRLATRSPDSQGLNLTRRTLNGTVKYPRLKTATPEGEKKVSKGGAYEDDAEYFGWTRRECDGEARTVEAALMDWADDVTYAVHDMDDFYRAGLIPLDRLCEGDRELDDFKAYVSSRHPAREAGLRDACDILFKRVLTVTDPYRGRAEERIALRQIGSQLITRYIDAVQLISDSGIWTMSIEPFYEDEVLVLKELTWRYVIQRPSLAVIQHGQKAIIRSLFGMYLEAAHGGDFRLFPPAYEERLRTLEEKDMTRTVVDLIASLSEPGAVEVFRRMSGVSSGSIVDATGEHA